MHDEPVSILVSGCAEEHLPAIRYAISELTVRLGVPTRLSTDPTSGPFRLIYGKPVDSLNAPVVPYASCCYDGTGDFFAQGTPACWTPQSSDKKSFDLIGGLFRLLSLADERHVAEAKRDRRGVFGVEALPDARRRVVEVPMVEHHVLAIKRLIERTGPLPTPIPRWPNGHSWAVLVTHDTDALRLSATPELFYNGVKGLLRRDSMRIRMLMDGLRHLRTPIGQNPLFGFPRWRAVSEARGIRSAFYLYVRRKVSADLNDCRSSVADPQMDWSLLREMADAGWEFGLHAPIKAKEDIDEFLLGKRFIEEHLGRTIFGLRHHYWAMDWREPHLSYRRHVNAGFRYDLSMAWRNAAGFRAGTCLPFQPWDPGRQQGLDIYAVPTAIMDGHVITEADGSHGAAERAMMLLDKVKQAGGVATLDWHTESAHDRYGYHGYRRVLEDILRTVLEQGDAWVTTPWSAVTHWHIRRQKLTRGLR